MKSSRLFKARSVYPALVALALGAGATPAAAEINAADIYQMRCADCHGAQGGGGWEEPRNSPRTLSGPPLRGNPLVMNAPPEAVAAIIRGGRTGRQRLYNDVYANMPPFSVEAVPDIGALVDFLKTDLQQ